MQLSVHMFTVDDLWTFFQPCLVPSHYLVLFIIYIRETYPNHRSRIDLIFLQPWNFSVLLRLSSILQYAADHII